MEEDPMSASKISRAKLATVLIAALFFLIPTLATAAHAPVGTACQECHSLSRASVFVGTKLIKKDAFLISANGGNPGTDWPQGTQLPCLFCHRAGRAGATEMKAVEDHFDTGVNSKHPVSLYSSFGGSGSLTTFDCVDCHTGLDDYVSSAGATIHFVNSYDDNATLLEDNLVENASLPSVDNSMCSATTCHDSDGTDEVYSDGHSARDQHGFTDSITLGTSGNTASLCSDCHATHKSDGGYSLIVLQTDGDTTGAESLIAPSACGGCHSIDDNGAASPYAQDGHGKSGIAYNCIACHDATVAHSFAVDTPTNPMRFNLPEDASVQSSIRQESPYNNAFSICASCHQSYDGMSAHGTSNGYAGCNDCHEPHGVGVSADLGDGDGLIRNIKMLRRQIPQVDSAGNPVYGDGGGTSYEAVRFQDAVTDSFRADGKGFCDNAECHQGIIYNDDALYPLYVGDGSGLMESGNHTGGDQAVGSDCLSCHNHLDGAGTWSASQSCTSCHGQPPVNAVTTAAGYSTFDESKTPHDKHVNGAGAECQDCHANYTNSPGHNDASPTYQSVDFTDGTGDGTATWPGNVPAYNTGTHECSNIYCHSNGAGIFSAITWNDSNWDTNDLACNTCHNGIDAGTQIASNNHTAHLAAGVTCSNCHAGTVTV
ncbi:MAG: hypothetical protein C0609_02380, partial [Deltaproteobacteria bacterium]